MCQLLVIERSLQMPIKFLIKKGVLSGFFFIRNKWGGIDQTIQKTTLMRVIQSYYAKIYKSVLSRNLCFRILGQYFKASQLLNLKLFGGFSYIG